MNKVSNEKKPLLILYLVVVADMDVVLFLAGVGVDAKAIGVAGALHLLDLLLIRLRHPLVMRKLL